MASLSLNKIFFRGHPQKNNNKQKKKKQKITLGKLSGYSQRQGTSSATGNF